MLSENKVLLAGVTRVCHRVRECGTRQAARVATMNGLQLKPVSRALKPRQRQVAGARIILLVLACFLAGLAAGVFWMYRKSSQSGAQTNGPAAGEQTNALSESTRAVLGHLSSPVEIRFYSLLDPATVPTSVQAFAGRVNQLLSEYQRAAPSQVKLTRYDSMASANDAVADGVKEFNADKGTASFLGITVAYKGRKEALSQLALEWEPALEPDLTRAIVRLVQAASPANLPPTVAKTDPATLEEVKRSIPNPSSVSVEEGTRVLREAGLMDFKAAATEMQGKIKEAEQSLIQARSGGTEADQQAALKHIQELQAEQAGKLKQIAAKSAAQVEAWQQLKARSQ